MAKVLVTGAGGFLGSWAVRTLLAQGHTVRAADLPGADLSALVALGAEPAVCDVTRKATVRTAVSGMDRVVHVGGLFDLTAPASRLWAVNAEGARVIAREAAEQRVGRFVLVSTSGVYGRCGRDTDEDAPKNPVNTYERSKWAGEKMAVAECKRGGVPIAVLRPTLIYGPGGRYGLAPWIVLVSIWKLRGARTLHIAKGGPLGHHVHVEDVARACAFLATSEKPVDGVFNIADDAILSGGGLVDVLADSMGMISSGRGLPWWVGRRILHARRFVTKSLDAYNPKLCYLWSMTVAEKGLEPELSPRLDVGFLDYMTKDHTYDTRRLKSLGFELAHPDVRVGLKETIQWYRDERWIP